MEPSVKPLHRNMGSAGVLFLTLSAATPASSLFIIVPDVLSEAGTGALIAMGVAALIAVCLARVYGELSGAFPLSGGEYAITARILGPGAGMAVLGMNLANSLLTAAVLALGLAEYLKPLGLPLGASETAVLSLLSCSGLAMLRLRFNALVTGLFLVVELLAAALLSLLGAARPERAFLPLALHPLKLAAGGLAATPLASLGIAATVGLFAYDGYGSAVYFGEELVGARRRLGALILLAMAAIVAAEVIPLAAVLCGAPDLGRLLKASNPFLEFARRRGGVPLASFLSLAVAAAIFNAVLATVLLTSRQIYAMARDGIFPEAAGRVLGALRGRERAPGSAALAAGGLAALLAFVDLKFLLIVTGAGVAGVYLALCVARLAWRPQGAGRGGGRVAAALAILALVGVFTADLADPVSGRPGVAAMVLTAAGGALYWRAHLKKRGRFVLTAPPDFDR